MTNTMGDLVLAKTLRDGTTRLEIRIEPQTADPRTLGHWLRAHWGTERSETFRSSACKLDAPPAPGITHAIRLMRGGKMVLVGLTAAEAAQVEAATRAWVQARKDRNAAERVGIELAAREAAPGARTWQVPDAYGHLAAVGSAARLADGTAVTALAHSSTYCREDGMSFGAADDAGYVYFTEVREATPAEAAELEAREARQAAREALAASGAALSSAGDAETPGDAPPRLRDLPGARIEPENRLTLAFGAEGCYRHLRADADGGWLWVLTYNGADGDDWSLCNCGSYNARRLPLTPERRTLFDDLAREFGAIEARNG